MLSPLLVIRSQRIGDSRFQASRCSNAAATGGADPEILESIRYNAPLDFSSQGRAVTVEDYKLLIPRVYPGAQSVQVWGGEDNDPQKYGKVFASIKLGPSPSLAFFIAA